MNVTAHKIRHTFHVSYSDLALASRPITAPLRTEGGDVIVTESGDHIHMEYEGDTQMLRAQKIGRNAFIAKSVSRQESS